MSKSSLRLPTRLISDPDLLVECINRPSSFIWGNDKDMESFILNHAESYADFHTPLESITFYDTQPGADYGIAETACVLLKHKDESKRCFLYSVSYDIEQCAVVCNRYIVFDDDISPALTTQSLHILPSPGSEEPEGLGQPLCKFYFKEGAEMSFYKLHANLVNLLPFYRLPEQGTGFNLMAWHVQLAGILDNFNCLDLERTDNREAFRHTIPSAAAILQKLQPVSRLGSVLHLPCSDEEYCRRQSENTDELLEQMGIESDLATIIEEGYPPASGTLDRFRSPTPAPTQAPASGPMMQHQIQLAGQYTSTPNNNFGARPGQKPSKLRAYVSATW